MAMPIPKVGTSRVPKVLVVGATRLRYGRYEYDIVSASQSLLATYKYSGLTNSAMIADRECRLCSSILVSSPLLSLALPRMFRASST